MRADFETIAVSRHDDHLLLVTLNRPEVSNAMNTRMGLDLMELFETLSIDLEGLRAAIITGSGKKAFCAGGDLKERNGMTDESWQSQHAIFERMVRAIMGCPIPLVAAVNGAAYGGGCEIAAASDFVYAATNARFALTEVTLGIMPGAGGTQESCPGRWRAQGEGDYPVGPSLHRRGGRSLGAGQSGRRTLGAFGDHDWHCPTYRRQRTDSGTSSQASHSSRHADVIVRRLGVRD